MTVKEWKRSIDSVDGKEFEIKFRHKDSISFAYSTTCHSFQGDEVDCIIIHGIQNALYFDRMALYTAASRARKMIIIVTNKNNNWEKIVKRKNPPRVSYFDKLLKREFMNDMNYTEKTKKKRIIKSKHNFDFKRLKI